MSSEDVETLTMNDPNKMSIDIQRRLLAKTKTDKTNALLKKSIQDTISLNFVL